MSVMTYREALNLALREEMRRDPRVFLIGEEIGLYDGAYKVTQGLLKEFGERRVVDTPICESGFTGVAVGAALRGRPPAPRAGEPLPPRGRRSTRSPWRCTSTTCPASRSSAPPLPGTRRGCSRAPSGTTTR